MVPPLDGSRLTLPFIPHTSPTDAYTLSLHDALPIWAGTSCCSSSSSLASTLSRMLRPPGWIAQCSISWYAVSASEGRSEEHTSELQSRGHLVCRLLLEKNKNAVARMNFLIMHNQMTR